MNERILIVDDEIDEIRKSTRLLSHTFTIDYCHSPSSALDLLRKSKGAYSAAVVDLVFAPLGDSPNGQQSGLDLIDRIRELYPETPIIALTAHSTNRTNQEAMQRGAFCFITKGQADTLNVLEQSIKRASGIVRMQDINQRLKGVLLHEFRVGRWLRKNSVRCTIYKVDSVELDHVPADCWQTQEVIQRGVKLRLKENLECSANVIMEERIEEFGSVAVEANLVSSLLAAIKASAKGELKRSVSSITSEGLKRNISQELDYEIAPDEQGGSIIGRRYLVAPVYDAYDLSIALSCSACEHTRLHNLRLLVPTGRWKSRIEEHRRDGSVESFDI